jgi:hypothetical protein
MVTMTIDESIRRQEQSIRSKMERTKPGSKRNLQLLGELKLIRPLAEESLARAIRVKEVMEERNLLG